MSLLSDTNSMENRVKVKSKDKSEVRYAKRRENLPLENSESSNKKVRLDNNMKKVAEIVMALATMGIRSGGRRPTAVEVELMVEAGAKLVNVCKGFATNDVLCKNEFGVVIEELLNSKVSNSEKLQVTKRKMEKSEVFPLQSVSSVKTEVSDSTTSRVTSQGSTSKAFITQPTVNPINVNQHSTNIIQTPSTADTHCEVNKIVQKLLHPNVFDVPSPSRDFMNKTLTCETCKVTINEMVNTLVCDACEKGYHLRCLQLNSNYIPKGAAQEWHCAKCLATSNGKPLQLRYGRVIRKISTAKLSSN